MEVKSWASSLRRTGIYANASSFRRLSLFYAVSETVFIAYVLRLLGVPFYRNCYNLCVVRVDVSLWL
jgi:hypothetical protein